MNYVFLDILPFAGFILSFFLLIFFHEYGHYLCARLFHIRPLSLTVGIGYKIFSVTDKRNMVWSVHLLPFVGAIELAGIDDPYDDPLTKTPPRQNSAGSLASSLGRSNDIVGAEGASRVIKSSGPVVRKEEIFDVKPLAQKICVVLAGPAASMLLGFIILFLITAIIGKPVSLPVISAVKVGSPAAQAGLQPGDRIVAIEGRDIKYFEDVIDAIRQAQDRELKYTVVRQGEASEIRKTLSIAASSGSGLNFDDSEEGRGSKSLDSQLEKAESNAAETATSATDIRNSELSADISIGKNSGAHVGRVGPPSYKIGVLNQPLPISLEAVTHINGQRSAKNLSKTRRLIRGAVQERNTLILKDPQGKAMIYLVGPLAEYNKHLDEKDSYYHNSFFLGHVRDNYFADLGLMQSVRQAAAESWRLTKEIFLLPYRLIPLDKSGLRPQLSMSGYNHPLAYAFYKTGALAAAASILIGLINLLPLPHFDGARLIHVLLSAYRPGGHIEPYVQRGALLVFIFSAVFVNSLRLAGTG